MDAPGRPMLYVTTDKFLRVFGINSLDELPETEALSVAAAQSEQLRADIPLTEEQAEQEQAAPADYAEARDTEEGDVIFESGVAPVL